MKTNRGFDLGLWKCKKGNAFTHITTNRIILLKKLLYVSHYKTRGEKVL